MPRLSKGGEQMDLLHNRASVVAEEDEDRISNLPHDIIHRILSFLDMKEAVQTCSLSRKWKLIWTSMSHLNFNNQTFPICPQFAKFVNNTLSRRNNLTDVFAVKLTCTEGTNMSVVESIIKYAYSHNVKQLTMTWLYSTYHELPRYVFRSHTLKHLTLDVWNVPKCTWDFPSLETLNLRNARLGDRDIVTKSLDIFSKCVKLKDLTLHRCSMFQVETSHVYAPQLINLTLTNFYAFPKVLNVVAPQLQNLSVIGSYSNSPLRLSTEGFHSLQKVNLSFIMRRCENEKERDVPALLGLFHKLCSTKYLILNVDILQALSLLLDELPHKPCPFNNLKCLKIDTNTSLLKPKDSCIATMATKVKNYLLQNSPTATFIMDLPLPQVPQKKRSMQEVHHDAMPKKVAKLGAEKQQPETMAQEKRMLEESIKKQDVVIANQKAALKRQDEVIANKNAELKKQDEVIANQKADMKLQHEVIANEKEEIKKKDDVIANQKAMLEAANLQHEKLMSHVINNKMAELKVQIENGNPGYELIRSMGCEIKSIMDLIPDEGLKRVNLEAQLFSKYEELKKLFHTRIDSQWANIETELLGNITHSGRTRSDNIHNNQMLS